MEVGTVYTGKVTRIMNFGAFVEFLPGKEGLVHISKLDHKRVAKVEDVVSVGDEILVRVVEVDKQGASTSPARTPCRSRARKAEPGHIPVIGLTVERRQPGRVASLPVNGRTADV